MRDKFAYAEAQLELTWILDTFSFQTVLFANKEKL
jgi:hypothetical protein